MGYETDQERKDARDRSSEQSKCVDTNNMVVLGRIASPFGIKGWLRVTPYTQSPEDLLSYSKFWLRSPSKGWQLCDVINARVQSRSLLIALKGVEDRTSAEQFCRMDVAVPESFLPELESDEFYWRDLLGMSVSTTTGVDLGEVVHVVETGANDVLVVRGERDRWIPFVLDDYVVTINIADKKLTVDWDPEF